MANEQESLIKPGPNSLTYEKYLGIKELLSLQKTLSQPEEHDETLFIIIHQTYELWFKQILHELNLCHETLHKDQFMRFLHALKRIDAIQKVLIHQVDILETMPCDDFNRFRSKLNPASGFQSFQFRLLEFKLGIRDEKYLQFYEHEEVIQGQLKQALRSPSLYDDFLHYLARSGLKIPKSILNRDTSKPHTVNDELTKVFVDVYKDPYKHSQTYMALEALLDLDEQFQIWRFRHLAMVRRMIGNLTGTGGSSGAQYLKSTLQKHAFPEIWEVRNHLNSSW